MFVGYRRRVGFSDLTVRSNENRNTGRLFLVSTFRRAISHGNRAITVGQQHARIPFVVAPFFQIVRRIERNADELGIFICKTLDSITEPINLLGSSTAKGAWEEPYQHVFARIIREAYVGPILIGQRKGGGCASYFR
jgi:hypothetical protein